ncbi:MAG: hypothetical protein Q7R35_14530 [Elusimicrobiota bacterium]|nr:hypothetical protein [Elusimicrobiota bacterium]
MNKIIRVVAVIVAASLGGCASQGSRASSFNQAQLAVETAVAPAAAPVAPDWTDTLFDVLPGSTLLSVGFSEPWLTDEATVLSASLSAKVNLLKGLYGEDVVTATGKFLKEHPLKGDMEDMSLSERFLKDVVGTFSAGRLKTFQRKVWRDTNGIKLKPGTLFVQVVYLGDSFQKAFNSADNVLDQYRKKMSLTKDAENELDGLLEKLEVRKKELEGKNHEKAGN